MSETRRSQRGAERGAEAAGVLAKDMRVPFMALHTISMEHHNKMGREASRADNFKEGGSQAQGFFGAVTPPFSITLRPFKS